MGRRARPRTSKSFTNEETISDRLYRIDANMAIDILSNIMIREADRSAPSFSSIDGAAPPGFLDHGAENLEGRRRDEASAEHRPHSRDTIRAGLRQVAFDPEIVVYSAHSGLRRRGLIALSRGRYRRPEIVDS